MVDNSKRLALVTGANKGIGYETSKQLAEAGISVLLGARDPARGSAAAEELNAQGLDVTYFPIDVTDAESITNAADLLANQYGRLDILVNNAGIVDPEDGPPSTAAVAAARRIFEVNFFGVLAVTQALIPALRSSAAGQIVMMSSSLGSIAMNGDPSSPYYSVQLAGYNASKAALNMLTVQLAQELKSAGISINAACPGYVKTDLSAHQGYVAPADAAKLPVKLALGEYAGSSGKFYDVNGEVSW